MRALFLVHNHKNRGSFFRALEIARRFARRGWEVQFAFTSESRMYRPFYTSVPLDDTFVAPDFGANPASQREPPRGDAKAAFTWAEMPCFTLMNAHQEGWSLFDNGWRVRDALARRWDVVYGFSHKPCCVLPALAAKARGARVVLDWADWWGGPEGLYRHCVIPSGGFQSLPHPLRLGRRAVFAAEDWWEGRVYRTADLVTLISEEYFHHPDAPKNLKEKSIIMHSGAPLDQIRPMDKTAARTAFELSFPAGAVVLGYVANFHMDETLLMDAFALLCRQRPDVHLLLAGAPLEATTPEQHAATAGRVHHVGWQPFSRMGDFLGAADILLLPLTDIALDRARYPHKLSDYVAAGRPVVACDVGETGRLLRRFEFGALAAPTTAGFAAKIGEVADVPEQWDRLGAETRAAAEQYFDWDNLVTRLLDRIKQS